MAKAKGKTRDRSIKVLNERQKLALNLSLQYPTWTNHKCYMQAYPSCHTKNAAGAGASRLFNDPVALAYLSKRRDEVIKQVDVDVQYVLRGLMKIVEFNPQDMLDDDGDFLDPKSIDPEIAKTLDTINTRKIKTGKKDKDGDEILKTITTSYKVGDKKGALELLGKYLKMFTDKIEIDDVTPVNRKFNLNIVESANHKD